MSSVSARRYDMIILGIVSTQREALFESYARWRGSLSERVGRYVIFALATGRGKILVLGCSIERFDRSIQDWEPPAPRIDDQMFASVLVDNFAAKSDVPSKLRR